MSARDSIERGGQFPYDALDEWWEGDGDEAPPPVDWAHSAARGILHDLCDRRGIKWGFEQVDEDVRVEITSSIAEIIRTARGEDDET